MIAVGSVVMNPVQSDDFPNTVCAVVNQKNQFAPGVMTKTMSGQAQALAEDSANAVLVGERQGIWALRSTFCPFASRFLSFVLNSTENEVSMHFL